jgi:hypothetical protein
MAEIGPKLAAHGVGPGAGQGAVVAEFSASDAAFTGFRIVAQRPWAVGIWAALQFVVSLGLNLFVAYSAGSKFAQLAQLSLQPPSQDPTAVLNLFSQVAPTYLVLLIIGLVLNAVLYAAMNRAVLRPSESRFGYLRLASDELRQLGLFAIFTVLALAAYFLMVIAAAIVIVIISLAAGEGVALGLGLAVLLPAVICAFIFLAVRLSLASPLTFDTHRISIVAAWRITRGRFWRLLGAYLIAFALSAIVVVLTFAIALAAVAVAGGGVGALGTTFQSGVGSPGDILTPGRLAYLAVFAIGQALIWPVTMSPPAAIYRALTPTTTSRVFD